MLIGEVSKRSGVSARMLRHYDSLGLVRPSGRTASGYREYSAEDLQRIFHVESLRSLGLSLSEVQRALDDPEFSPATLVEDLITRTTDRLERERELLAELRRVQSADPGDWPAVLHIVSLLRALGGGDERSRQRAALSSSDSGSAPAASLAEAVLAETETNVAGALRWALARAGAEGLAGLAEGLSASDPQVRRRAVEAVADIDDEHSGLLLLEVLTDPDDVVRERTALALAARGYRQAAPALIDLIVVGQRDVEAAEALAHLAHTPQIAADFTTALLQRADDGGPQVRRRIVQALAEIPGPTAEHALTEFAQQPDPSVARPAEAILRSRLPR